MNVIVPIEKDGGFAGSFERFCIDKGMECSRDDFDFRETGGAETVRDPGGGAFDIGLVFALSTDGGNTKKFAELGEVLLTTTFDKLGKVHMGASGTNVRCMKVDT